ncbi:Uncharacterised protein [Acinetobacter baumannii]|nr:Uncharacterised protein [Acinetobacter baumannii]
MDKICSLPSSCINLLPLPLFKFGSSAKSKINKRPAELSTAKCVMFWAEMSGKAFALSGTVKNVLPAFALVSNCLVCVLKP